MPIDPRIPLGTTVAQLPSPIETMTALGQLQAQREATQARRLASEEAREKAQEAKAARARQAQVEQTIRGAMTVDPATGQPTVDWVKLLGADVPTDTIFKLQASTDEARQRVATLRNTNLAADEKVRQIRGAYAKPVQEGGYHKTLWDAAVLASFNAGALTAQEKDAGLALTDPAAIKRGIDSAISQAGGAAAQSPTVGSLEDYVTRYAASLGKAPTALTPADITTAVGQFQAANRAPAATPAAPNVGSFEDYVVRRFGATPTAEQITQARKAYQQADDRPGAAAEPLVQVTRTDPATGELVTELVPRVPGEVSRRPAPEPTKGQYDAGLFAGRLAQAEPILTKLESAITGMNVLSYEFQLNAKPTFQSAAMQSYTQAARNFINAVLRRESGAVISPEEFAEARKQYLPQPGEDAETLAQKKANRDYVSQTLRQQAGPAYQAPVTPPPPGGGGENKFTVTAPNGTTYSFNSAAELAAFKRRAGIP